MKQQQEERFIYFFGDNVGGAAALIHFYEHITCRTINFDIIEIPEYLLMFGAVVRVQRIKIILS